MIDMDWIVETIASRKFPISCGKDSMFELYYSEYTGEIYTEFTVRRMENGTLFLNKSWRPVFNSHNEIRGHLVNGNLTPLRTRIL